MPLRIAAKNNEKFLSDEDNMRMLGKYDARRMRQMSHEAGKVTHLFVYKLDRK